METKDKAKGEVRRPRSGEAEARQNTKQRPPEARPARSGEQPRRRPAEAAPSSAQQSNGAARTEEAQRRSAPRRERPAENPKPVRQRPAGKKPAAPARKPLRPGREPDDTLGGTRRAYGKTKPKKKSSLSAMSDVFKQTARRTAEKAREKKKAAPRKKHSEHSQIPTPAVIYTEPTAFNRSRFTMQLLTVTAVVLALVLGLSVFFKVKVITVSGAEVYSAWSVREASGIKEGDNLLSFGNARAGAQIKANLPYVEKVRLGIKLPDTVNIMIEERNVVYAVKDQDGIWWLMTSAGIIVEKAPVGKASNYTQILGVALDSPVPNEKAVALESASAETDAEGELIPVAVTGAQRLTAALQILQALEANDVVGAAASVEVTRMEDIILWYGTRYQVNLGDATRLDYKIDCMTDVILQMSNYQSGILDISFNIWPDKVGYTPF